MLHLLKDQELLLRTSNLVKVERQATAEVLEYLSEIDKRRLWLREGYASLFDFCVRYLKYSEGEAARRIQSARCVARVEEVKPLLENNEISLTGVSLIAPFLTKENAPTLLPEVQGKSRREIEKVLVEHFPEARTQEEFLKIRMDEELKALLAEAQKEITPKDPTEVYKVVLRRFVSRRVRNSIPKKHTRYIPEGVKRQVRAQSDGCCEYRGPTGTRCNQTAYLQHDHVRPWAKGGSSWDTGNIRLLCRAHNLMLGERAFGARPQPVKNETSQLQCSLPDFEHRPGDVKSLPRATGTQ